MIEERLLAFADTLQREGPSSLVLAELVREAVKEIERLKKIVATFRGDEG